MSIGANDWTWCHVWSPWWPSVSNLKVWSSLERQAMLENRMFLIGDIVYSIHAQSNWKLEAYHMLYFMNCESSTFLVRGVKEQKFPGINVLCAAICKQYFTISLHCFLSNREDNYGYVLSSYRKMKSRPTYVCAVGTFVMVMQPAFWTGH